jgi:hypothetical protein
VPGVGRDIDRHYAGGRRRLRTRWAAAVGRPLTRL